MIKNDIASFDIPEIVQRLVQRFLKYSGLAPWGRWQTLPQGSDAIDLRRLLHLGRARCKEIDRENDCEPDQPHGHLDGGWLAGV